MGENRSLDDFFSSEAADDDTRAERTERDGDSSEAAATDGTETDGSTDESGSADASTAEPDSPVRDVTDRPRTTYRWSPDGADCPACGASAEAMWRDGDRFVCADCKEWA